LRKPALVKLAAILALTASAPGIAALVPAAAASAAVVTVGAPTARTIPAGFVGLSFEQTALKTYAGQGPNAIDPVFEQLVRNLAPSQRPVLRIGGDTTDWSYYSRVLQPHRRRPPWVRYTITPAWIAIAHALATGLDARLILGVNLEANSGRIAGSEARAFVHGIGSGAIAGLELGNEPELYGSFNWYRTSTGAGIRGRPRGYDFAQFSLQFNSVSRSLPHVPLAGPAIGSPNWSSQLGAFLRANPRVKLATVHRYPLQRCAKTTHYTPAQLLAPSSSTGLAASVAPLVGVARRHGAALRVGEINAVSCGGQPGLSNSFAAALWSLDTMFALAGVGVGGVNIHTAPGAVNQLFSFRTAAGANVAQVYPLYYGLLTFAQAAPAGARLLRTTGSSAGLRTWATRGRDGHVRVVLINPRARGSAAVTVRFGAAAGSGPATLVRLSAPSLTARDGVTLGGQGFGDATTSGLPVGTPRAASITVAHGGYAVSVPAASAAVLTL
jgi:hypothetical protein